MSLAGTAGFGRRDALKALINLELDFESPDFTQLSEDAKSFVKVSARPRPHEAASFGLTCNSSLKCGELGIEISDFQGHPQTHFIQAMIKLTVKARL